MKHFSKFRITNSSKVKKMIVVEPWAEVFELLPEQTFEIVAKSDYEGEFEIDFNGVYDGDEYLTIYAWSGCQVEVIFEEENICHAGHITAFEIPKSFNNLSEFTKKIFGGNEK